MWQTTSEEEARLRCRRLSRRLKPFGGRQCGRTPSGPRFISTWVTGAKDCLSDAAAAATGCDAEAT
jgi:hypothetical protein